MMHLCVRLTLHRVLMSVFGIPCCLGSESSRGPGVDGYPGRAAPMAHQAYAWIWFPFPDLTVQVMMNLSPLMGDLTRLHVQ